MSLNLIPHTSTPLAELLTRAAYAPLDNVGWIRVTGEDRVRWLNGMVTNNIAALKPGEGCYCFFLNAQGRIQGDCTAWMMEDAILLETEADRIPAMLAMLDRFIIMDDVELTPLPKYRGIAIMGLRASELLGLASAKLPPEDGLSLLCCDEEDYLYPLLTIRTYSPLMPRYELWSVDAQDHIRALFGQLNTIEANTVTMNQLRILSGTPLYGVDIRDKDLPQETNQTRALHFAKGCYLGQEIVERIRSRGAVHRTFMGFILHGDLPPAGTILTADDKPAGELTSVTSLNLELKAHSSQLSETSPLQIALGYIRREALDRTATITYPGGTATPTTLPFQIPELRALHA